MQINPLQILATLYRSEDAPQSTTINDKVIKFNEESTFFANFFRVRTEDLAPFLAVRFLKDMEKKQKKKMRRVNKKSCCVNIGLRKKQANNENMEGDDHDYA